jgi:hypothetical protein
MELGYSTQIYETQYTILFINSIMTFFLLFFRICYQIIHDSIEKNENLKSPYSGIDK